MALPRLDVKLTNERIFEGINEEGKRLIALVDEAERLFPEQSVVIIKPRWEVNYKVDGRGFRDVINQLESTSFRDRTDEQEAHLAAMRQFADTTWPRPPSRSRQS